MNRISIGAAIIAIAAAIAVSSPATAKSGHGGSGGGTGSGGNGGTQPLSPTIRPNDAVKEGIWRAVTGGTIKEDDGIEAGD